ncbi:YiaAB two helix domain-containing protein [Paraburkholderia sacchari]
MSYRLRKRIDSMFARDRLMAGVALLALWVALGFVYFAVSLSAADPAVRVALTVGAAGVVVFNTASVTAMVRHYKEDKDHIYGLDIHHLDENRLRKAALRDSEEEEVLA